MTLYPINAQKIIQFINEVSNQERYIPMEDERHSVVLTLTVTNQAGKISLANELTLGEMKLEDVKATEKAIMLALAGLLG